MRRANVGQVKRLFTSFKGMADKAKNEGTPDTLEQSIRRLDDKLTELRKNEAFVKTREFLQQAKKDISEQNKEIVKDVQRYAERVSKSISDTKEGIAKGAQYVAEPLSKAAEKIAPYLKEMQESHIGKSLSSAVDKAEEKIVQESDALRYGGVHSKAARERLKMSLEAASKAKAEDRSEQAG